MDEIEFWVAGDWTMVYLNGELVCHGDSYHADEWLQQRCGVKTVYDDRLLSVPDGRNPVKSLAEVRAAEAQADERTRLADEKRRQAEALITEADQLIGKA